MAVGSRTTASTSSFIARYRVAVLVLLAPKLYLFFLGALDAPLAHLDIVLDLGLRELSVLPEDDVEAKPEHAEPYKYQSCKQNLHLVYEARADFLVVVDLPDDVCKHLGH